MTPTDRSPEMELSLLGIVCSILRHRVFVVGTTLFAAAIAVAVALILPRTYTSVSSFMPQSRRATSSISGIAAQLGLPLPTTEGAESPGFYAELVKTHALLLALAQSQYTALSHDASALAGVYGIRGGDPAARTEEVARKLNDDISAQTIQKSGVVRVTARAHGPALARQLNERVLELVNRFNQEQRRSQAAAERQFTERRFAEVRADLRAAEDSLQTFISRNRTFSSSPQLMFEHDRLTRSVSLQQQVYTTLAQSYETAKIEEVRDTPVITVVERPTAPVRADSRGVGAALVVTTILALFLTAFIAIIRDFFSAASGVDAGDIAELTRLRRDAAHDARHPFRALARALRRNGQLA
jgi:uncharacterized protein involved in exopolysaccharide biosynthesis